MESFNTDVVVIGGGLAGLTAAAVVAEAGRSVVVVEQLGEVGGAARSTITDGFTFNRGPHALTAGGPAVRILQALGVTISGGKPPFDARLVFADRAEIAPAGAVSLLRTKALSPREKVEVGKLFGHIPKLNASGYATTSTSDWVAGAVRSTRVSELVHSLVRLATYSHAPDRLSADLAILKLQAALRGDGVIYVDGGWQSLVDQLRARSGVRIVTGEGLHELPDAPAVIVAVGGPAGAADLLSTSFDVGPAATVSCLDLGLRRRPTHDLVIGGDVPFYFSNHSAVADLAPRGSWHAAVVQYMGESDEPDAAAIEAFARLAGVRDDDVVVRRRLHQMTASTSIPTATRGGLVGRSGIADSGHDNVFLAGDWIGPVGHLSDASVASGQAAANAALVALGRRRVA